MPHPTSVPVPGPLHPARFLERPNRFLLRLSLEGSGEVVEAHMADPGRLRELLLPGRRVWLRHAAEARRKTRWSALLVEAPGGRGWVGLDATLPNRLIRAALEEGALDELAQWRLERSEARLGGSRLDFVLSGRARGERGRRLVVEVKSVTLVEDGVALFPDAVTARGARHLGELAALVRRPGWEAAVLFVLQRSDAREIRAARSIDPRFARELEAAREAGVRILGRRCSVHLDRVELGSPVPVGVG